MSKSLNSQLSDAMARGELVRIERKLERGFVDGYVIALSRHWFVLLVVGEGITFVGYQAFRPKDVSTLAVPAPRATFVETVLRKRKLHRPAPVKLDLSSAATLLLSANVLYPLVTLHCEVSDPDVCHIGRVVATSRTTVTLQEITPDATWDAEVSIYRLAEITRVDFGGPYEDALWLVGGSALPSAERQSHLVKERAPVGRSRRERLGVGVK